MRTGRLFERTTFRVSLLLGVFVPLCLSCTASCFLHPKPADSVLTILTYNVQTLFDDVSNGTEYAGFDPASGSWNAERYRKRLEATASVIEAAVDGGPDIVALQEVESRKVLDDLASEFLAHGRYAYRAVTFPSGSALGVGILSRYPLVLVRSHALFLGEGQAPGRDILEVVIACDGAEFVLFNNHWKSKTEGAVETEPLRLCAAGVLGRLLRERLANDPEAEILALGDLNESADEYLRAGRRYQTALIPESEVVPASYHEESLFIRIADGSSGRWVSDAWSAEPRSSGERVLLYSPWGMDGAPGSYRYGGEWLTIDHFLLSPGLLDERSLSIEEFRVVREEFLCGSEGEPLRWESSSGRGYSDHFPLLLTLRNATDALR